MVVPEQIVETAQNEGRTQCIAIRNAIPSTGLFSPAGRAVVSMALTQLHISRMQSTTVTVIQASLEDQWCALVISVPATIFTLRSRPMPKAYAVVTYRSVSDPAKLAAYAKLAGPAVLSFGARFLARGNAVIAREQGVKERTVVVDTRAWRRRPLPTTVRCIRGSLEGTW